MRIPVLVLAGRRAGGDVMADASGLRHRALLPIAGVPMLERVVSSLQASEVVSGVTVTADDRVLLEATAALASWSSGPDPFLRAHPCADSPASSVAAFLSAPAAQVPLLVTTADHPLLSAEMVRWFVDAALQSPADLVVGMVPASVYRRRFPDQPRTFIPLRGEKYSGANLFLLRTPEARCVASFWTRAEAHRKTPWKLVRVFGLANLALFLAGRLDLAAALRRASRVIGAKVAAVELPFAEAALDVDKEADRVAVEAVFAERARGAAA